MEKQLIDQQTGEVTAVPNAMTTILTQRTPSEFIKTRKGRGGKILSYVSHDYVTRTLNEAFAFQWSFEIASERIIPEDEPREVVVRGRLTVHAPDGDLVKEQFGGADIKRFKDGKTISLADDLKAASSDALKKCASLLGLALDLYGSDAPPKRAQSQSRHKAATMNSQRIKPADQPTNGQASNPATLFEVVNAKTNGYYQNAAHLHEAIGGWPDFTNGQEVAGIIEAAIKNANRK